MQNSCHRGMEQAATLAMPLNFRAPPDGRSPFPSSLSLGFNSHPSSSPIDHNHTVLPESIANVDSSMGISSAGPIARVRLSDIVPYEGAPSEVYVRAVEVFSRALMRHNAVVIELGSEDATIVRCALESTRMYYKARNQGKSNRGVYMFRAGRELDDGGLSPPCMTEVFKSMGKAARASLSAVAKLLRLRSNVFNDLLDDCPLPPNEVSSSALLASFTENSQSDGKRAGGGMKVLKNESEKGLLALIASDSPGIQVCDSNGDWYLADGALGPGDLLLITGRTLSQATAGLRPATSYRTFIDSWSRASLTFRLVPRSNAVLDCSPLSAAGHVIPRSYRPTTVSRFMDDLSAEEDRSGNHHDNYAAQQVFYREPSLRSLLSDSVSGTFLEDAVVVSCGHSFGGELLKKVIEMARCSICNAEIRPGILIPNYALRSASVAMKNNEDHGPIQDSGFRKRRKEKTLENIISADRLNKENREFMGDRQSKGVCPFAVNDRVVIKGNRRTPEKFVGKEAVVTSQCFNGWCVLKLLHSGESVRLQYSSLCKIPGSMESGKIQSGLLVQSGS